jgi:hypothetical protein
MARWLKVLRNKVLPWQDPAYFFNPVIWKEQVALVVGAAPTGGFYDNLDFPDKRLL